MDYLINNNSGFILLQTVEVGRYLFSLDILPHVIVIVCTSKESIIAKRRREQ
jgi:hypothetical protein